jgi:hypothetical protein
MYLDALIATHRNFIKLVRTSLHELGLSWVGLSANPKSWSPSSALAGARAQLVIKDLPQVWGSSATRAIELTRDIPRF